MTQARHTTVEHASPSRLIAQEVRAEMGRQGLNQTALAQLMGETQFWVSRRLSPTAKMEISIDEVARMAKALDVSVERLLAGWLPRLDSNQEPSGYPLAQVIELGRWVS